jgi:rhodanese-related sulfurtransferase
MRTCCWLSTLLDLSLIGAAADAEHTKDSLDTVKKNLAEKKAVIIDVREQKEWNQGHLEAAELIPLSEMKRMATDPEVRDKFEKKLPKDRIIYCHCAKGVRALSAGAILEKLGYDVRPLAAGFEELGKAGFPVSKKP